MLRMLKTYLKQKSFEPRVRRVMVDVLIERAERDERLREALSQFDCLSLVADLVKAVSREVAEEPDPFMLPDFIKPYTRGGWGSRFFVDDARPMVDGEIVTQTQGIGGVL